MSNKGNFAQALRELTGFDAKEEDLVTSDVSEVSEVFAEMPEEIPAKYTSSFSVPDFSSVIEGQTSITSNMKVIGDIKSDDNLNIKGQVFGNITTSENILTSNLIVGDIKAKNVAYSGARLKGNSVLSGNANVEPGSVIVGDISSENIKVSGKIKGDLSIKGAAILTGEGLVMGNIKADDLSAESGAKINGAITITRDQEAFNEDVEFDLGGDF